MPVNVGANTWNAIIPTGKQITYDLPTGTITGLSLAEGSSLNFSEGRQLNVLGVALIRGDVYATDPSSRFNAPGVGVNFGNSARLRATLGAQVVARGVSYVYTSNINETTFLASGESSLLDLSALQQISNNGIPGHNSQPVWRAAGGGVIDLSGLRTLIGGVGPAAFGVGRSYFVANGAGSIIFGRVTAIQYNDFHIDGASSHMQFDGVSFGGSTTLNVGQLRSSGDFSFKNTDEATFNLGEGKLVLNGGAIQNVEVGGRDIGLPSQVGAIEPNFQVGQFTVGQLARSTVVRLIDNVNNGNRGTNNERELLYAQGLPGENGVRVLGGSTLVLDEITLYAVIGNVWTRVNDLIPVGQDIVAYDGGFLSRNANVVGGGWKFDGNGAWSSDANWHGNIAPNAPGRLAYFGSTATAPITVTVDGNKAVGYLGFDNVNTHTIAGTSTVTMQATGGGRVEVRQGSHIINAPLRLASNTTFDVGPSDSTLTVADLATTNANVAITKVGEGVAEVNTVRARGLTIERGTMRIAPSGTNASVSRIGSLAIADDITVLGVQPQGTLDLTDNALIIDYTLVSPLPQVKAWSARPTTMGHGICPA